MIQFQSTLKTVEISVFVTYANKRTSSEGALQCLRPLIVCLSSRRYKFVSRTVHLEFLGKKMSQGQAIIRAQQLLLSLS